MMREAPTARPTIGELVEQLAMIWSAALGIRVNEESDYFELGGDSMMAVAIAHAVADCYPACIGLEDRALQELFECATLSEYADHLHGMILDCNGD